MTSFWRSLSQAIAVFALVVGLALVPPTVIRAQGTQLVSSSSPTVVLYAWVQWEADGLPHARAVIAGTVCPDLVIGKRIVQMSLRSGPSAAFADSVCDSLYPAGAKGARVGTLSLPPVPVAPTRIAVFGDTGCRLKGKEVQACNDGSKWPLAKVAAHLAAEHPQLVIHVGDYYYRETPCPATGVDCTGSPFGDRRDSWVLDFFQPVAPLFAAAPMVLVRGNHEDCERSPRGWSRYLSGLDATECVRHEPMAWVRFKNLQLGNVDSAYDSEFDPTGGSAFIADERDVDTRAGSVETWLLTHRPPVAYLEAHRSTESNGDHIATFLSGHIHVFAAATFEHAPPQLIVGTGGDNLEDAAAAEVLAATLPAIVDRKFGYAMFEKSGSGWNVIVKNDDGSVRRHCRLEHRKVSCTAT